MSKIPEGATHQCPDRCAASTGGIQYYRFEEGRWSYWPENLEPKDVWAECKKPCKPVTPIAPTWNGPEDGLPPVGIECEYGSDSGGRQKIKVLAHTRVGGLAAVGQAGDMGQICMGAAQYWRPIRTAEQLAAEEREQQIEKMAAVISQGFRECKKLADVLYDAGARMPGEGSKA